MVDGSAGAPSVRQIQVALGRYQPVTVRVERSDGDALVIKPVGKRGKWQRVIEALPDDATRIEMLDKGKAVLWAQSINLGEDDEHQVDDEPAAEGITSLSQMFQLVQNANDIAQRRAQEFVSEQQTSALKILDMATSRLAQLEANYSQLLQLAADSSTKTQEPVEESATDKENAAMLNIVLKAGVEKGMDKLFKSTPKPTPTVTNGKGATK